MTSGRILLLFLFQRDHTLEWRTRCGWGALGCPIPWPCLFPPSNFPVLPGSNSANISLLSVPRRSGDMAPVSPRGRFGFKGYRGFFVWSEPMLVP